MRNRRAVSRRIPHPPPERRLRCGCRRTAAANYDERGAAVALSRRARSTSTTARSPKKSLRQLTRDARTARRRGGRRAHRGRSAIAPGAEDGGDRQPDGRRRARLQQRVAGDQRQSADARCTSAGSDATARAPRSSAATDAVQRGAKLAAQLLAFARRQPLSPAVRESAPPARRHEARCCIACSARPCPSARPCADALWNVLRGPQSAGKRAAQSRDQRARRDARRRHAHAARARNVVLEPRAARETPELAPRRIRACFLSPTPAPACRPRSSNTRSNRSSRPSPTATAPASA